MTGREHLEWCVERAMVYANLGEMAQAWASFASDCLKHEATRYIPSHELYGMEMFRQVASGGSAKDFKDFVSGWAVGS